MNQNYAWALSVSLILAASGTAQAQVAEVPDADNNGDFNTAIVQGNRGFYPNERWVVVTRSSDDYLNCRESPNGEIHSRILPGAIVTAAFGGSVNLNNGLSANYDNDAVVMHNERPWLRVVGQDNPLLYPASHRDSTSSDSTSSDSTSPEECYVRANLQYITPLNNEADAAFQQ